MLFTCREKIVVRGKKCQSMHKSTEAKQKKQQQFHRFAVKFAPFLSQVLGRLVNRTTKTIFHAIILVLIQCKFTV